MRKREREREIAYVPFWEKSLRRERRVKVSINSALKFRTKDGKCPMKCAHWRAGERRTGEEEEIRTESEVRRKNRRSEFGEEKELEKSHQTRRTVCAVVTERGGALSGRNRACVWEESGRPCPKRWRLTPGHYKLLLRIISGYSL